MDQGTVDSPVTLVIKAPNQKYDDQTINCFLNWTVEKLKKHISNVYPSKPLSKDQRLVYSGRLLQDHLQLRDVLRKQDEYHMVHLVCASRSPPSSPTFGSPISTTDSSSSTSDSAGPSSSSSTPSQETPANSDGLRHRGNPVQTHGLNPAPTGVMQRPEGMPLPMQGGPAAGFPAHPMYMPMQMFWWQQMYARHYYVQYQAAMAASRASSAAPSPTPSAGPATQPAQPNEPAAPMGPNPAPEDRPANPNIQMNAQGGAMLNDDELNRDWLDWMYTVSRAAILLSIVYFYSSFGRFVMVIGAMLLVYLHQAGWFPFRAELQNPRAGEGPQDEAEQNQDLQEMERMMDEGMEDDEGDSGEEGPEDPMNAGPHQPGFLSAAWSFISTFFTSLIPEGPAHAAN
ncbi:homocysteine-responsive endoplasmic reticulum-resident ubiquitin-like domain member 2 protein [Ctenopharyngodon idella]|uniref:homocysteine-responsive endoplasmic reticulum-resident ubiquitin-like domain member 2 protein n=1 Tax=Ctenopharyngodon idella TaxID=7959 RepID=UPI00222E57BB|nr:homocysteine-responsive endoplasmic reticulum-resident ubiquitin-like domain member 2 protein [Ctenopharyngodon idella]XP_051720695.1 homocysteine-responsive endoplasmic reticulum-resident ubiquitin-like domain member 2 protein [Ctenopharyngodon idella]